jgi:hypothetical protein
VLVSMWMPHLKYQHTHVRLGPPDSVRDVSLLTQSGRIKI